MIAQGFYFSMGVLLFSYAICVCVWWLFDFDETVMCPVVSRKPVKTGPKGFQAHLRADMLSART